MCSLIIFRVQRRVICQAVIFIYYTNISVYINKCYSLLLLLLLLFVSKVKVLKGRPNVS